MMGRFLLLAAPPAGLAFPVRHDCALGLPTWGDWIAFRQAVQSLSSTRIKKGARGAGILFVARWTSDHSPAMTQLCVLFVYAHGKSLFNRRAVKL